MVGFPRRQPIGDAPAQLIQISEEGDLARFFDALKSRDGGLQFHAIVGGGRLPASRLAHVIAISKQRSPTARSGVSITSAVSVDCYLLPTATFCHAQNVCCSLQSVEELRSGASASQWKLPADIPARSQRPSAHAAEPAGSDGESRKCPLRRSTVRMVEASEPLAGQLTYRKRWYAARTLEPMMMRLRTISAADAGH